MRALSLYESVERAGLRLERRHRFCVAFGASLHGLGVALGAGPPGVRAGIFVFARFARKPARRRRSQGGVSPSITRIAAGAGVIWFRHM